MNKVYLFRAICPSPVDIITISTINHRDRVTDFVYTRGLPHSLCAKIALENVVDPYDVFSYT